MKKAKIMLIAIAVLTILGGALAFKAKKFDQDYCTTTVVPGHLPGKCIVPLTQGEINILAHRIYFTPTGDAFQCPFAFLNCYAISTSLTFE